MVSLVEQVFAVVVGAEGVLSTNSADRGNWTSGQVGVGELKGSKYGVSAMAYPTLDIKNLTIEDATRIFEKDYFCKAGCNRLPAPLAVLVADAAYNNGPDRAAKWLQLAVGVTQDGVIGPATLAAVAKRRLADVLAEFHARRILFQMTLPTVATFGLGWARRLARLLLAAMALEGAIPQPSPAATPTATPTAPQPSPEPPPVQPAPPPPPAPHPDPSVAAAWAEIVKRRELEDHAFTDALNQRPNV